MALHPVDHLSNDYCVGSSTAPLAVFSNDLLDVFCAARAVKGSFGVHTIVEFWSALTLSARASGVPLPPPPPSATLRVAAFESDCARVLRATEAGAFTSCPTCGEVARGAAVDGQYKCRCYHGAREGTSGYVDGAHNTVANTTWVPRREVLAAEAVHAAGASQNERSCGGAGSEGVHMSTSRGQSSTGLVATICSHHYPLLYSDLARGERWSQLGVHAFHWQARLESQLEARAHAAEVILTLAPEYAKIQAGGAADVFAVACAFLRGRDLHKVAPLVAPSPAAPVAWTSYQGGAGVAVGGVQGGAAAAAAGSAGAESDAVPPATPLEQGQGGAFFGLAETAPPSAAPPLCPAWRPFLTRSALCRSGTTARCSAT